MSSSYFLHALLSVYIFVYIYQTTPAAQSPTSSTISFNTVSTLLFTLLNMNRSLFALSLLLVFLTQAISLDPPKRFLTKKYATVHGRRMAYVEVGTGDPIVFLHGNPTSSYLWRNVMPHLESQGRLIAPDLIGFGDSDKLPASDPSRYIMLQHANYLFALLEQLGVKRHVTLVIHDWGSALGFLWAYRNRFNSESIKGIAFMEAFVQPFTSKDQPILLEFKNLFRPGQGETLVLQQNYFIEEILPMAIIRNLTMKEMNEYRRPFLVPGEGRRAMLTAPRQIPFDGKPIDVQQFVANYAKWMVHTSFPKLLISANPGVLLTGTFLKFARTWKNLEEFTVRGLHFVQEDEPDKIGKGISEWLRRVEGK